MVDPLRVTDVGKGAQAMFLRKASLHDVIDDLIAGRYR